MLVCWTSPPPLLRPRLILPLLAVVRPPQFILRPFEHLTHGHRTDMISFVISRMSEWVSRGAT